MHAYLETKFWICHIRKQYNAKKSCNSYYNAWYYIQWSHKIQYVEVYELWHRKWVVWHMNKLSYICSIILWTYRTGFLGILTSFPLPSLCRDVQPTAWQRPLLPPIANCNSYTHMKKKIAYEMIRITKRRVTFNTYARNLISTTEWNLE